MNHINVIAPYNYEGLWVFDDEKKGLVQEPFVGGADTILDVLTAAIPDAANGFRLIFSGSEFPGYQYKLLWQRSERSGDIYQSPDLNLEGWLCPALLRYFDEPPAELFIQLSARK